jgi:hypothetical protein
LEHARDLRVKITQGRRKTPGADLGILYLDYGANLPQEQTHGCSRQRIRNGREGQRKPLGRAIKPAVIKPAVIKPGAIKAGTARHGAQLSLEVAH